MIPKVARALALSYDAEPGLRVVSCRLINVEVKFFDLQIRTPQEVRGELGEVLVGERWSRVSQIVRPATMPVHCQLLDQSCLLHDSGA
jgi:hypothetical protein